MTRRPADRTGLIERPRHKGWWGLEEYQDEAYAKEREIRPEQPLRHAASDRPARSVPSPVGRALTQGQIAAIRAIMHLFVEDDLTRGVDPRLTIYCHRCEGPRTAAGSVRYGSATLCNDCGAEYEIALGRGLVESVPSFLER